MRILGFGGGQISEAAGGYNVDNSLRFNDGSSDNLSGTLSSGSGSDVKGTISLWVKRSHLGTNQAIICGKKGNTERVTIGFSDENRFEIQFQDNSNAYNWRSNALYRDISAWYNCIIKLDTGNGTATSRARVWINNEEITSWNIQETVPQNLKIGFFNGSDGNTRLVGARGGSSVDKYFDGYICEVVGINNSLSDNTDFGEVDEDTGIWKPKDVSGLTFGTNGFYLDFENSGSLGEDVSGNGNNFTVNNLTSIDQSTDTCTNNFATYNVLLPTKPDTFSEGNTKITQSGNSWDTTYSTIGVNTGKWYMEVKWESGSQMSPGFSTSSIFELNPSFTKPTDNPTGGGAIYTMYSNGSVYRNNSENSYGTGISSGNIQMLAMDLDNNKFYWGENGTWFNSANPVTNSNGYAIESGDQGSTWHFHMGVYGSGNRFGNFGSPSFTISSGNSDDNGYGNFEYSVPSGYYALNTKNLAEFG